MTQIFDARAYDATRYRITQVGATPTARISSDGTRVLSWPFGLLLYAKLLPGIAVELNREELLGLLVADTRSDNEFFRQQLGAMFTKESLSVKAWIDGRWVTASLNSSSSSGTRKSKFGIGAGTLAFHLKEHERWGWSAIQARVNHDFDPPLKTNVYKLHLNGKKAVETAGYCPHCDI